jgi:hypothetical protein
VQINSDNEPELAGVISEGDGHRTSLYVPVTQFAAALHNHSR